MPKDSLAIVELGKEDMWKTDKVKNFKTPLRSYGWVAYQLDKPIEQPGKKLPEKKTDPVNNKIADSLKHIIDSLEQVIQSIPEKKKKKKEKNDDGEDIDLPIAIGTLLTIDDDADGDDASGSTADAGNDLVVRNIATGEQIVFYKVVEYFFSKTGNKLLVEQAKKPG
jgi:hypothetical protein